MAVKIIAKFEYFPKTHLPQWHVSYLHHTDKLACYIPAGCSMCHWSCWLVWSFPEYGLSQIHRIYIIISYNAIGNTNCVSSDETSYSSWKTKYACFKSSLYQEVKYIAKSCMVILWSYEEFIMILKFHDNHLREKLIKHIHISKIFSFNFSSCSVV